jgi:hypothetical protein
VFRRRVPAAPVRCWAGSVDLEDLDAPSRATLARRARRGDLTRLRRGTYLRPEEVEETPEARHRQLVATTVPLLASGAVVSHLSAAVVHGLWVWEDAVPGRVQVTRPSAGRGKSRGYVHQHTARLLAEDVTEVGGMLVTTLERTVVDLARTLPVEQAVAAGDAALRRGATQPQLLEVLGRGRGWPGLPVARRVVAFLDPRSESAGESASRVVLHRVGLMPSDLQLEVVDPLGGRLVGRCDFGWREHRTVGEFDGRVKYGRLLTPGQRLEDVLYAEKRREDALRDCGWQVVRWNWADLWREQLLSARLHRAFARRLTG